MQRQEVINKLKKVVSSHNGHPLDQKALLKSNKMVAKILIARFLSMTRQQQEALKGINTPETAEALKIFLPEMSNLIEAKNGGQ